MSKSTGETTAGNQPAQVLIENPVINSPYSMPSRHFVFSETGITDTIAFGRRPSSYFMPIATSRRAKGQEPLFDTEWTQERIEENKFINDVRQVISEWRLRGYPGVTPTTLQLLDYWSDENREKKLFFCQIEALEAAIYLTEVAEKAGSHWMISKLADANQSANPGLDRIAFKMATGTGKTVVMAMLIAWHCLNKKAAPTDARFSDSFLVVTPGITIRDRLRVLQPWDEENYYKARDLVPVQFFSELLKAQIVVTNFHSFQLRDKLKTGRINKMLLKTDGLESPDEMVRRVCRIFGNKKNIVILNDEAHHCYRRRASDSTDKIAAEEKAEIKEREEEAKVWVSGLEAITRKIGARAIFDLSATPFFLKGSGYEEGTLFPWVVSDFALIDAIEAGIVKVPRVPISDNSGSGEQPTYRDLWLRIRDELPKKGRKADPVEGQLLLPVELQAALHSLYGNYKQYYQQWQSDSSSKIKGSTPPVFIVVCNNTSVSRMVFDYISGWEREIDARTVVQAGKLDLFRNDDGAGNWNQTPVSILIDSAQLESGEALSDDFKAAASKEIEEFKQQFALRSGAKAAESISDSDILREVMNTVGKPGKLGENIRCVVSVSMLTEGWDANTVTHVLGVRAFSTQLLCEQVVGRALRRRSYAVGDDGLFEPEYAEIYGVPFSFIPTSGSSPNPKVPIIPTRVRALESRKHLRIEFPHVTGYRFKFEDERLAAEFDDSSIMHLSTQEIATKTQVAPIVGEESLHNLDDIRSRRLGEVQFTIASTVLERYFKDDDGNSKPWLFPQVLNITRSWINQCVSMKDNGFVQQLLLAEPMHEASEKIYRAIVSSSASESYLVPIMRTFEPIGSTDYVDFDTVKPVFETDPDKCHITHVVADTASWEQKMASVLEELPIVKRYVKNQNLGFSIPYVLEGRAGNYLPDFIAVLDAGDGKEINLVVEVSGEKRKDKAAKVATARDMWVPSVNRLGLYGEWNFVEVDDPWNCEDLITSFANSSARETVENG